MPGVYYPLSNSRAGYKAPQHTAIVAASDAGGLYGVSQGDQFEILDSATTFNFLTSMPPSAWVYTYNSHWINDLFPPHLGQITKLEAVGDYQSTTYATQYTHAYIIDLFQVTMDSLRIATKRLGLPLVNVDDNLEQHLRSKVAAIRQIKDLYNQAVKDTWGVHPSKTTGATALKAWRASLSEDEELKIRGTRINTLSRHAIRPGGLNWKQGYYPYGYLYDINASYVHAMRVIKLPTQVIAFSNREPGPRWIATVRLNYQSNLNWGTLPVRAKSGELYRPVIVHDHVTTITYLDYALMQLTGQVEITEWLEGITWQPTDEQYLFTPWIDLLINSSKNPVYKYLLKNVSRSLHSKFAQNAEGSSITLIQPTDEEELQGYIKRHELKDIIFTDDGNVIFQVEQPYPPHFIPFAFPQWEALILAAGRLHLYSSIDQDTIYTDTDSLISTRPRSDLAISHEFGAWKLQAEGETAIIAPRSYVCGNSVKCSGIKAKSRAELRAAIIAAAHGENSEIDKIELGNLIKQTKTATKHHTVKMEKYPMVELIRNMLRVTRSPTVEIPAIETVRLFSIDKPVF